MQTLLQPLPQVTPARKAEEIETLAKDVERMLRLRMGRADTTGARIVAIGELLHGLETIVAIARQEAVHATEGGLEG